MPPYYAVKIRARRDALAKFALMDAEALADRLASDNFGYTLPRANEGVNTGTRAPTTYGPPHNPDGSGLAALMPGSPTAKGS